MYPDVRPNFWDFRFPVDWLSEIPDSSEGTGKIKLKCINRSTGAIEYEETKTFKVYVPEAFKPEISNLNVDMVDKGNLQVDYTVYGLTKPRVFATVTPHFTSPIKKCYIIGGGVTALREDITLSDGSRGYNLFEIGEFIRTFNPTTSFTVTVEDGRGRTASITSGEFYVHQYNRPIVKSLSAYRTDKDGIAQADGGYIKVTVEGGISPIRDSKGTEINTLMCLLSWKEVKENSYGLSKEITNNEPFIFEADKDLNYEIRCTLRDKFLETVAYCSVMGDNKDFNIADGGGGAAIGTKATKGYFDVAHNSRFQKEVSAKKKITSEEGLVSTGIGSRGDFLSFGTAEQVVTKKGEVPIYDDYGNQTGTQTVVQMWGDFNDCTDIGVYGIYSNEDVRESNYYQVLNSPCEKAGTLRVYNATGSDEQDETEIYLMQEYVVYDGSEIYRRCLSKTRDNIDVEWPENWTYGEWKCFSAAQDYIVEQGTRDGWTYKKWSDGTAECWCAKSCTLTWTDADAVLRYTTNRTDFNFPVGLFSASPCVTANFRSTAIILTTINASSNTTCGFNFVRVLGGADAITGDLYVQAKGTWK